MPVIAIHLLFVAMFNPVVSYDVNNLAEYNNAFVAQFEQAVPVAEYKFND